MRHAIARSVLLLAVQFTIVTYAGTEGTIKGSVTDSQGVSLSNARVALMNSEGKALKDTHSSVTGEFSFFPVEFGDYAIRVEAEGFNPYEAPIHVTSGAITEVSAQLVPMGGKEMVIKVSAKKRTKIQSAESRSSVQISKDEIKDLPQGDQVKLPKLIASTTPGVVQGTFGQLFFRGNHANIQYQIDGVQLPESPSNTFGDAFTPRNIDHMEIITGGIPAEYGERLSAVVNIVSKTGPEVPGGSVELNYGTYNTFSPTGILGGSSSDGKLHYYFSGNFNRTDRGLDTPQPISTTDQSKGGADVNHDLSQGNNEFLKMDWLADNSNKVTFIAFNSYSNLQIPTFPNSFSASDSIFTTGDQYGNGPYLFIPPGTDDQQKEQNSYVQMVWKHTFSEHSFLQLAPYFKYSYIGVQNDRANDLAGATLVPGQVGDGSDPVYSSFSESRHVNNYGLKGDYTWRPSDVHLVKTGFQLQASQARGSFTIETAQNGQAGTGPYTDDTPNDGYFESVYVQDDFSILKSLVLNAGLRFDATQFNLGGGTNPTDSSLQPRVGLSYSPVENTKFHIFYGKLFQPAPVENLRDAFVAVGGGQPTPYDIKAERSDFFEGGVAQAIPAINQAISVTVYRKNATNLLDDAQLLNTAISQPINFADGFVYGTEVSIKGEIMDNLSDYLNYSYTMAKGSNQNGGIFTQAVNTPSDTNYYYLDHLQMHTLNAGLSYRKKNYWVTAEGIFGSGLRTGDSNRVELPHHFTMDATVGYEFHGTDWYDSGLKVSLDVLNLFDNRYAVSVANGFNGSHYAPGRQFYAHLVKEF